MIKALYVHIPFCKDICAYCDFSRARYRKDLVGLYLKALQEELNQVKDILPETIYIGGGTPTALEEDELIQLLEILKPYTEVVEEYTIEMNPDTITLDKVQACKRYGINRVSLGVQATQDNLLQRIQRKHSYKEVVSCVELLQTEGFDNISIDLMYGLPDQTIDDVIESIKKIQLLNIQHISIYSLTIEPNSYFGRTGVKQIDSDLETDMYALIMQELEKIGFYQYEISNFSKVAKESKHNQMYWLYEDFYGAGLSASGKIENMRYTNTSNFKLYFSGEYRDEVIDLNRQDIIFESIMMNLRMNQGIHIKKFEEKYMVNILEAFKETITKLVNQKLLTIENEHLKVTQDGRMMLNDVLVEFMD